MDAEFLFNRFFERLEDSTTDKKKFTEWVEEVAEKITEIAVKLDDDKLIDTILEDKSFHEIFGDHYDTLLMMFKEDRDIEKSAYEILDIMIKNKKKKKK